ncbi:hypothetical protein [Aquimarina algiphila]|uniref:Uncharacterized protein n=1 Tax=Aquimarina algiphila TaxID=2047982 RepID=A0A554VA50_9FLAO|nr:hypothetical protein [Aquimarina algiphila]TSE02692.1 hypothetical protein FOF46_30605 [Aquimarina algiphila]
MKNNEEKVEDIENELFRKISLLILNNLEKYGPERVANELNEKSEGNYYVVPTEEGVREYVSNLINRKFK